MGICMRWRTYGVLLLALIAGTGAKAGGAEPGVAAAVKFSDIDLQLTRLLRDGKSEPLDADRLRRALGLSSEGRAWGSSGGADETPVEFQYLLVFKQPLAIGTMYLALEDRGGTSTCEVRYLRPEVTAPPDPADGKQWVLASENQVFEPGFRTRALLLTDRRSRSPSGIAHWLFLKPRLISLTAQAVGSAEQAPFAAHPNSIPQGRSWFNTAADPNPGAPKQILRGPVSEALPSWYILSWENAQRLSGLWCESNADRFNLYAYRGDPRLNPALAASSDWKRIEHRVDQELPSGRRDQSARLVSFEPLETLAIKLELTSCRKGPVAEIRRLDALLDLGDAPRPTIAAARPLPFAIRYTQPFAGEVAMVVKTAEGRTIRNLFAQQERLAGPRAEGWDLKDEAGQMVSPGVYRWQAITAPPLGLRYQMTPYPNAPMHFPGQTPWLTGEAGPNGWLADHATHFAGTALGDKIYFGAPGVEGGVSFIECDANGRKQWAKHSFAGFTGLRRLAADNQAVFIHERNHLCRMNPESHEIKLLATLGNAARRGEVTGMAAADGSVYLSFHGTVPAFDNATEAQVVDLENCLPRYPDKIPDVLGSRRVDPNPRQEFLRLLRLTGTPSGQQESPAGKREPHFPVYLETAGEDARNQCLLVAFRAPVPLGSIVFPCPGADLKVELSVLKRDAAYPPNPLAERDWISFPTQPRQGWVCVPAPPDTLTRALLVRVSKAGAESKDPFESLLNEKQAGGKNPDLDDILEKKNAPAGREKPLSFDGRGWFARLEGMKLLRRRFTSLLPEAQVRVNSGKINKAGEWDAERTEALSPDKPGIFVLEWAEPQKISGLAIKEIDGERTEIDVWEGPAGVPVSLDGAANWRQVATYQQPRRDSYQPSFTRNECARYLDGSVDFQQQIATRAVRLRVVQQWADLGERGTDSQRNDRGGRNLDPRRCRIFGVAPLQYVGGESATDSLTYQRIEVRDARSGDVVRELPSAVEHSLCVSPQGELFGIRQSQIVKVDRATGAATPQLPAIDGKQVAAQRFTIGPNGDFYVFTLPAKVIQVFDPQGQPLRTIGHPGGEQPGPWDPQRFLEVNQLFVANDGHLWVVESQYVPRRIVQYKTDGTLVKEMLGNTNYGGGGVLDRHDKSRLYFHHVQFELDWETGRSRIKNLLANWMPADYVPVRVNGRTYLASAPLSYQATQRVAAIYLVDDAAGTARPTAAFGAAEAFDALKTTPILARLAAGKVLSDFTFLWSDRSGNGQVEPDEVTFEPKSAGESVTLGRFNRELRCCGRTGVYQVHEFLPNGTPVFEKASVKAAGIYALNDGSLLDLHAPGAGKVRYGNGSQQETRVNTPDGRKLWAYGTEHSGVSGLWVPPWEPGYVTNEFGIIGHEVAAEGELGEFFVVHANNGQWKIWTADGLLAGTIMRHKFDPRSHGISSFSKAERGLPLDNLTADQEHFHGFFTRSDQDGKYYAVHGGNFITLSEVTGLEKFQRLSGEITVTAEDVKQVRAWEEEQARREVKSLAKVIECLPVTDTGPADVAEMGDLRFGLGYDEKQLHLRWTVRDLGPLKNSGGDYRRLFKTGAGVDLLLSTNPQADPSRQRPAAGDLRLLLTFAGDKPQAVLYQPLAAGAAKQDAWETSTPAGGTTAFERVVRLSDVKLTLKSDSPQSYTLSASVPLETLGLKIREGMRLKLDWGVLGSEDGFSVKRRMYWSNQLATGTADEAVEARLEPHLWGTVVFSSRSKDEHRLTDTLSEIKGPAKSKTNATDLLDDLDQKPKPGPK